MCYNLASFFRFVSIWLVSLDKVFVVFVNPRRKTFSFLFSSLLNVRQFPNLLLGQLKHAVEEKCNDVWIICFALL